MASTSIAQADLKELLDLFEHASTFGSLIQVPATFAKKLSDLESKLNTALDSGDIFAQQSAHELLPLVKQAKLLAKQYDAVIANPPYMGSKFYAPALKKFIESNYKVAKGDLYTCFMVRNEYLAKTGALIGMITIPNWMFLSSYEELRKWLFEKTNLQTMSHNGRGVFGSDFGSCAFIFQKAPLLNYKGAYKRLFEKQGSVSSNEELDTTFKLSQCFYASVSDFKKIPGSPVAYWVSDKVRSIFSLEKIGSLLKSDGQLLTGNNEKFLRNFWEIKANEVGHDKNWKLHHKGGDYRKWYGNVEWVVAWDLNTREHYRKDKIARIPKEEVWDLEGVTWSTITSANASFRKVLWFESFNKAAPTLLGKDPQDIDLCLGILNSKISEKLLKILNPTVNCLVEDIEAIPILKINSLDFIENVRRCVLLSKGDWDSYENSWDFNQNPIIRMGQPNLEQAFNTWQQQNDDAVAEMKRLEEENNKLFIDAYGLQDELTPDVPDEQITLTRADREKDSQRLVSYAIGCMMGRYSLDESGLIYAHAGIKTLMPAVIKHFQPMRMALFH